MFVPWSRISYYSYVLNRVLAAGQKSIIYLQWRSIFSLPTEVDRLVPFSPAAYPYSRVWRSIFELETIFSSLFCLYSELEALKHLDSFNFHWSFPFSTVKVERVDPVFDFIQRFNECKWGNTELCGLWTLSIDYFEFITYRIIYLRLKAFTKISGIFNWD